MPPQHTEVQAKMNSLFRIPGVRLIAGISLSIVSVALTFACAELLYRLAVGEPEAVEFIDENLYDANAHEKLGYLPKADNSYTARKSVLDDGRRKSIYEVTYTTDLHHRRTVGHEVLPGAPHLLLFGGSSVFGEGLPDISTLQYQLKLGIPSINVYNYSVHGWGTANMLAALESLDLTHQVQSLSGGAIYTYLWFHEDRNIGSNKAHWTMQFPYYEPDADGRLVSYGAVTERRPGVISMNSRWETLTGYSRLLSLVDTDFARWGVDPAKLTAGIIIESKRRYKSLFDGKFLVLDHPMNAWVPGARRESYLRVLSELDKAGVTVINLHIEITNDSRIPYDGHPSALLNQEIASELATRDEVTALFARP